MKNSDQVDTGLRAILKKPLIYLLFQRIMGCKSKYNMYVNKFLMPARGIKILDIGCGCSEILEYLPMETQYVGYDMSASYIKYARSKYGHRATFHNQRVSEMNTKNIGGFDIIMADGLLHHLNDNEADKLFKIATKILNDSGFLFTADPTFVDGQGFIARLISSMDRGRHVRRPEQYKQIAESSFSHVKIDVITNVGNRPQTGCFMKCFK